LYGKELFYLAQEFVITQREQERALSKKEESFA
jgi:hypothetical protein